MQGPPGEFDKMTKCLALTPKKHMYQFFSLNGIKDKMALSKASDILWKQLKHWMRINSNCVPFYETIALFANWQGFNSVSAKISPMVQSCIQPCMYINMYRLHTRRNMLHHTWPLGHGMLRHDKMEICDDIHLYQYFIIIFSFRKY